MAIIRQAERRFVYTADYSVHKLDCRGMNTIGFEIYNIGTNTIHFGVDNTPTTTSRPISVNGMYGKDDTLFEELQFLLDSSGDSILVIIYTSALAEYVEKNKSILYASNKPQFQPNMRGIMVETNPLGRF